MKKFIIFNLYVVLFTIINTAIATIFMLLLRIDYPVWYWSILGMFSATQTMVYLAHKDLKSAKIH
jgi:hypothetical protein